MFCEIWGPRNTRLLCHVIQRQPSALGYSVLAVGMWLSVHAPWVLLCFCLHRRSMPCHVLDLVIFTAVCRMPLSSTAALKQGAGSFRPGLPLSFCRSITVIQMPVRTGPRYSRWFRMSKGPVLSIKNETLFPDQAHCTPRLRSCSRLAVVEQ